MAFQQMSELLPVPGIDISSGLFRRKYRKSTTFLAVVPVKAKEPQAAKALIAHFKTPAAIEVIRKWGMEPG